MRGKLESNEKVQQLLDEIMKEIAALVMEVRSLAVEVGNYVNSTKEVYKKGKELSAAVLEVRKALPDVKEDIRAAVKPLKKKLFMQRILMANMTHPEIVDVMKSMSKKKAVVLDGRKKQLIVEILSGKMNASQFAVKMLKGEGRE